MTLIRILIFLLFVLVVTGAAYIISVMRLPAHVRKAREYLESDDLQKAGEIVRKILKKRKDHIPARVIRAEILLKQKQYFLSISEMTAIFSTPDFRHFVNEAELRYKLAEMYHETQQYQKEIEEYKLILAFNPNDIRANHRVGHVLYNQHSYNESRDCLSKAYFQDPSLTDCLVPLGIASYHIADYTNAEQYLLKSLEFRIDNFEVQFHLGLVYRLRKEPETALKMFTAAKQDRKYYIRSMYNMAEIYFESEMYETAIEILEEGLGDVQDNSEESLEYRYLLAECYEMSNKIKEAVYHWEKIYDQNSNYRSTRSKLEDYHVIMENENQRILFTSSLEELQPLIIELLARLNYNIITKTPVSPNEYVYKAFNTKRLNDPQILIFFNRTTREITEAQLIDLHGRMESEKCKSGMYLAASRFSIKAKNAAPSLSIELLDSGFLNKNIEKIMTKRSKPGK